MSASRSASTFSPQIAPPATTRVRPRILDGETDTAVLRAIEFLGNLLSRDLAKICRASIPADAMWSVRKQRLTAPTSARWAGAITKEANRLYVTARVQRTALPHTRAAVPVIRNRLGLPLRSDPRPPARRYRSGRGVVCHMNGR